MSKTTTIFECSHCGAQAPRWSGRCLECGKWGTIGQDPIINNQETRDKKQSKAKMVAGLPMQRFDDIKIDNLARQTINYLDFDRVLGGGLVSGSLILLGGEPGIGKSTLVLQLALILAKLKKKVLYVSAEESGSQVKIRLDRLGQSSQDLFFLAETNLDVILGTIERDKPNVVVIDSIQTVYTEEVESASGAGSVAQVRVCTVRLMEIAKRLGISIILIGHVTKEGTVAGPKTLEHLVDVVLYIEGDRYKSFRILRVTKNRFGSTNEISVLEMGEFGLTLVANPSQLFLLEQPESTPGSVVTVVMEGKMPFLVEIQALTSKTSFGYPVRKAVGFDANRLQMIIAVLVKKCGVKLDTQDIYVNVVGGLKIDEPAVDLAVAVAIVSSLKEISISQKTVVLGEVGLAGEIRNVSQLDNRLKEAGRLGFGKAVTGKGTFDEKKLGIKVTQLNNLSQVVELLEKKGK